MAEWETEVVSELEALKVILVAELDMVSKGIADGELNQCLESYRLDCKRDACWTSATAAAAFAVAAGSADCSSAVVDLGFADMSVGILARMTAFAGYPDSAMEPADSELRLATDPEQVAEVGPDSVAEAGPDSVAEAGPDSVAAAGPVVVGAGPVAAAGPVVAAAGHTD